MENKNDTNCLVCPNSGEIFYIRENYFYVDANKLDLEPSRGIIEFKIKDTSSFALYARFHKKEDAVIWNIKKFKKTEFKKESESLITEDILARIEKRLANVELAIVSLHILPEKPIEKRVPHFSLHGKDYFVGDSIFYFSKTNYIVCSEIINEGNVRDEDAYCQEDSITSTCYSTREICESELRKYITINHKISIEDFFAIANYTEPYKEEFLNRVIAKRRGEKK